MGARPVLHLHPPVPDTVPHREEKIRSVNMTQNKCTIPSSRQKKGRREARQGGKEVPTIRDVRIKSFHRTPAYILKSQHRLQSWECQYNPRQDPIAAEPSGDGE